MIRPPLVRPARGVNVEVRMPDQSPLLDASTVAGWAVDAHTRTMELVEDLTDDQLIGPQLATVNPLVWEIGHLAWFMERFVLRQACQEDPILPFADSIWDSGAIPHDTRWRLVLPSRSDTLAYMTEVANRVADRVTSKSSTDVVRHFALYTVFHHDMHAEAITYTRHTLSYPAPRLASLPTRPEGAGTGGAATGDVEVAGCRLVVGATRSQPFVFDHEKWGHPVDVPAFAIARCLVTQGEFAEFVDDHGYDRREFWSTSGWEWRQSVGAHHPVYWRNDGDSGWSRRHFDTWSPLEANLPVIHVCYHEADAYCRWARRRLPTEAEWEVVASTTPDQIGPDLITQRRNYPWGDDWPRPEHGPFDWQVMGTAPVGDYPAGDSGHGCRQLVGSVWQWTSTTFLPYPNFERDAYRDNAEPWFGSRKVLRGGAWATRSRFARNTFRNYFTPDRRDVMAGFRTCSLER
ncbi:MAG: selenoneine synthase SenA [Actinomycetota bacterium]